MFVLLVITLLYSEMESIMCYFYYDILGTSSTTIGLITDIEFTYVYAYN